MRVHMTCSSIWQVIDVKEMGQWFAASTRPPFLKTGVIHASFHRAGTSPASIDIWKNAVIAEARYSQLAYP